MKRKLLLTFCLASSILSHAAAADKICTDLHSESWCVLDIAGLSKGAKDLTPEEANESLAKGPQTSTQSQPGVDTGKLLIAAADLTRLTSIPPGLTPNFSASLWIINAFTDFRGAGQRRQMFVLLPQSKVIDDDPSKTVENAYIPAFAEVLGATSYAAQERLHQPTFGAATLVREYILQGGRCTGSGCLLSAKFFMYPNSSISKPAVIESPPQWFGQEKHYLWTSLSSYPMLIDDKKARIFKEEDWIELFRHLPNWFYHYIPSNPAILVTGSDRMRLLVK